MRNTLLAAVLIGVAAADPAAANVIVSLGSTSPGFNDGDTQPC